jgi:hypothetical protein
MVRKMHNKNPKQKGSCMAKKDVQENFKYDDELADKLRKTMCDLDRNKSEVIRACLHLALPILRTNPLLIKLLKD